MQPLPERPEPTRRAPSRDRVTLDLRGLGNRLQALAAARGTTASALVRKAALALLEVDPTTGSPSDARPAIRDGSFVKVTLRIPAASAVLLAARSRRADVSQGTFVAGLLDGAPLSPLPHDHGQAVRALMASTDRLAVMSTDLNAFLRPLGRVPAAEVERYRAGLLTLAADVRSHLAAAAQLMAELRPMRRAR